ncbi:hypothetical protein OIU84_020177 [Salix udensis]|uniref:Uncharacterized protein n=1 Tax=Salix udensis TaxID=889485 RepID=A0AAD6PKB1_9ROSI|nr:hypothetical protein OIU84_020177 [Salix udensis]
MRDEDFQPNYEWKEEEGGKASAVLTHLSELGCVEVLKMMLKGTSFFFPCNFVPDFEEAKVSQKPAMEGKAEAPPKMASTTDTMKQKDESRDRDQVSSSKTTDQKHMIGKQESTNEVSEKPAEPVKEKALFEPKPKQDFNIAGEVKDVKIVAATSAWKDLVPWSQAKKGNQW